MRELILLFEVWVAETSKRRTGFDSLPVSAYCKNGDKDSIRTPTLALAVLFFTMILAKVAPSIGLVRHAQTILARAKEQHRALPS